MRKSYDAVVIGAGPNGLSAGVELASHGLSVCIFEAQKSAGGGARTAELTFPGFLHDICSAIHPMGALSPFFAKLSLEKYGFRWMHSPVAVAHPLDNEPAALLVQSLHKMKELLGIDGTHYYNLMQPFVKQGETLLSEILGPVRIPKHPLLMARFGKIGTRSALAVAKGMFQTDRARALFAGCSAHSVVALDRAGTASFGLVLALVGHLVGWPFVAGGSQKITDALVTCFQKLGGQIVLENKIESPQQLPEARAILFDTTPRQLIQIASAQLPKTYLRRLERFQYGPGVFKIDWALNARIPWKDPTCANAATVHLGGTIEEIVAGEAAIWKGKHPEKPFVLFAQQSCFDPSRAPAGKHTAWGYCHVPHGSTIDMTQAIEDQVERFAPGFRELILARHTMNSQQLEEHNANMIGGDIGGGANTLLQFIARPLLKWDPYSTPNPKIFLASSSTPPGGGVHGMCGFHAARSALRRVFKKNTNY